MAFGEVPKGVGGLRAEFRGSQERFKGTQRFPWEFQRLSEVFRGPQKYSRISADSLMGV